MIKKLYRRFFEVLPQSFQGSLSKIAFAMGGKPFVQKDNIDPKKKFPNKEKGGLIISADLEMAWAWRYTKTGSDHLKKGRLERKNFPKIIQLLENYDIPITFAVVGHLFLEKCQNGDHDWMKRIPHFDDHWKFTRGDWYDHDPHSNYKDAPEWYAPDLIKMILNSKVEHEVGSHTFSHIDFSYRNCPPEVAVDEIKACLKAAEPYGINLESIVFPGGTRGNIEVLKKHNFTIYRKRNDFDLSYPYIDDHGVLVTTSSGSLEHDLKYGWSAEYFLKRLEKYVAKAVKTNTSVHFWFHPSLDPYFLEKIMPHFFKFAADQREKGNLWIGPMNQIAYHINKNKVL
jgi:peptidoglycan/xylan/chitin deacetylase (PgdA/CDA1 family)